MNPLEKVISSYYAKIKAMEKKPFRNRKEIRRLTANVQAIEATRDVLTTFAVSNRINLSQIDKNSYKSYDSKVEMLYKMYNAETDYGGEVLGAVADIRCAFIGGEGISISCKNKKKEKFIEDFLKFNKLDGSRLLNAVRIGEFDGKVLFLLSEDNEKKNIKARLFSYHNNKYKVVRDSKDYEIIKSITYTEKGKTEESSISIDKAVYMRLGGADYLSDDTPTKLGKVLTQCENASRALYDLRNNTHLFGKVIPTWETAPGDIQSAKAINKDLQDKSFEIGDGYAGSAKFKLNEPSGAAGEAIIKDLLMNMRFIASMTAVPIHWLSWPELMSNRATAENLLEVVSAGTKLERLVWEEGLRDIIDKACEMAQDAGYVDGLVDIDYTVKLPLISLAALMQIIDVWLPILQAGKLSDFSFWNMLPGIDPAKEKKAIEDQEKENAEKSPLRNRTLDGVLNNMQNKNNEEGDMDNE